MKNAPSENGQKLFAALNIFLFENKLLINKNCIEGLFFR
jgi:hypothetical protein